VSVGESNEEDVTCRMQGRGTYECRRERRGDERGRSGTVGGRGRREDDGAPRTRIDNEIGDAEAKRLKAR
jgi:hypothetical protein